MNFLKIKKFKDYNVMKRNFSGLHIMKDEIREEIRKMKSGKATGTDSKSVELFGTLGDYRIDQITTLLNEIYYTHSVPREFFGSSLFIERLFLRVITKILVRIIVMRVRDKIKPEIVKNSVVLWREKVQQLHLHPSSHN